MFLKSREILYPKVSYFILLVFFICAAFLALVYVYNVRRIWCEFVPQVGSASSPKKLLTRHPSVQSFLEAAESIRTRFVKKREKLLIGNQPLNKLNPWDMNTHHYFWNYFPPTITCPHLTERIGNPGDGGKWVCGFEIFEKRVGLSRRDRACIVYSFGVAGDSSFEEEFLLKTNCSVFAYDFSVDRMIFSREGVNKIDLDRLTFSKKGIWGGRQNLTSPIFRTLGELMRTNNHTWIDFLKVDIEGNEYKVFDQITKEFKVLPFGHLNLEVHLKVNLGHFKRENEEFQKVYKWWNNIENSGLRAFSWENNHAAAVRKQKPILMEYAFLNVNALQHNPLFQF